MKKKVIIGGVIAVVVLGLVVVNVVKSNTAVPAFGGGGKAFSVKVKKLEKGNISASISASGSVEEVEKSDVYLDTGLKVDKVLVEKNQKVARGQKLFSINMDAINSELDQAKIKKNVQELTIQKTRIMDGTKSTAALEAALVVAENNLKNAESTYDDAVKAHEKNKALFEVNAIAKNDLERSEKAVNDTKIALDTAQANYRSSLDNLEETRKNNTKSASSTNLDLETQEQNLKATLLSIADIEKKIKTIQDSMLAPIDGAVTDVLIKDGALSNGAQPALTITNTDKLQIKAAVKEFDIRNVAVGQSVSITGDAISKEDDVKGKVTSIAPTARKNKTTSGDETVIDVVVSIEKSSPVIKPGLGVTCSIFTKDKTGVVVTALDTLLSDKDDKNYVYVYDEKEGVIRQKFVKLGITSDMNAEIMDGLNEGEQVVIDPQPTLKDGAKAKVNNTGKK